MSPSAFPCDPMMPGVPLAIDPSTMQDLFAAELLRTSGADYGIERCRVLRIRYRPAEHCFINYELGLRSTTSGQRLDVWLTGIIYPDERPRRRLKKLLAACAGDPAADGWRAFGPGFYLPEPNMMVQTFPCDRRLPSLPRIVSGMSADLQAALPRILGPGDWRVAERGVQTMRYRALSGAVLRVAIEAAKGEAEARTGRRKTRTLYVKVGRAGEGEHEARLLETLHAQALATAQPFTVTRPLAYVEPLSALIVEEAPGISFERAVLDGVDVEDAARRTARGLAAFHQWTVTPRPVTDAVIARTGVAADYVGWACPALAGEVREIVHAAGAALARTPLAPSHLDLKPDHVFLDGERVVFIDLDTFGGADPVLDVATLLARLAAMPARFGALPDHVDTAARVLTQEYFARVPAAWRSRLATNQAVAAVQVASEFFRHQHRDWRDLVPAWIARARRALDAGVAVPQPERQLDGALAPGGLDP